MGKRFPHIRLHGDKTKAAEYVRRAKQEVFKLKEMQRTSKRPILQAEIVVDDFTTIRVQLAKSLEIIDIVHTPPAFREEEVQKIPEVIEPLLRCPPIFIVYKNKRKSTADGYLLSANPATKKWQQVSLENYQDSANAGWYGLNTVIKTLNNPDLHKSCDLVTWYGNPSSMCDDQIFNFGVDYGLGSNTRLLVKAFYYQGKTRLTPEYVLGACILPEGSTDYYYILCTSKGVTRFPGLPDNRLGGTDELIYRKDVTKANHASNDWELIGSIPYTDYGDWYTDYNQTSTAKWYMSIATAYVDIDGVAWFTKVIVDGDNKKRRILLKVNLRTGVHSEEAGRDEVDYWYSRSGVDTVVNGGNAGTPPAPVWDEHHLQTNSANGEQYVYTMGGLEARYDLYVKVVHNAEVISDLNATHWVYTYPDTLSNDWATDYVRTKTIIQNTNISLLIRKEGKVIWEGPLVEIECNSTGTYSRPSGQVGPGATVPGDRPRIKEYFYMFLHPHALKHTTWFERDFLWGGAYIAHATTSVMSFMRGDEILVSHTGEVPLEQGDNSLYHWQNYNNGIPFTDLFEPVRQLTPQNDAGSGSTRVVWDIGPEDGRPPFVSGFSQIAIGIPIAWPVGTVGYRERTEGYSSPQAGVEYTAVGSYSHACEQDVVSSTSIYQPQYMAVHRPIKEGAPWSYILCLQQIIDANPTEAAKTASAKDYKGSYPFKNGSLQAKVREEDDWLVTPGEPIAWIQSNSWQRWAYGAVFEVGENTRYKDDANEDDTTLTLWRCTSAHTVTVGFENYPGSEGSPWERIDPKVEYFSNVLTEAQLKILVGEDYPDVPELGVI